MLRQRFPIRDDLANDDDFLTARESDGALATFDAPASLDRGADELPGVVNLIGLYHAVRRRMADIFLLTSVAWRYILMGSTC